MAGNAVPRHLMVLFAALIVAWSASAKADFEVLSGQTRIDSAAIVTDVKLDLELTDAVVEAVDKGIEIRIVAVLRLIRVRPWIWDEVIGEWRTGFTLKYHDLSSTYVLTDDRDGELESFSTIRDAMDSLADLEISVPAVTETLPDSRYGYRASLRVDVDRSTLPPPLKLITDISPAWRVGSGWKEWTVER